MRRIKLALLAVLLLPTVLWLAADTLRPDPFAAHIGAGASWLPVGGRAFHAAA